MESQPLNLDTLSTVLNEVGAYIFIKNLEGKYTYANRLVLELFNTTLEELLGKDDYFFFDEKKLENLLENDKRVFNGMVIEKEEVLILKRTQEKRHFLVVKKPLYDKEDKIIGMFGISTDITQQKKLENKITEQNLFLDAILDNVDAYIYMKDENRVFRYVNSKVAKLFNKNAKDIIGKKDCEVIPKNIADEFWQSDYEVLKSNKKIATEEYFETKEENKSFYWSVKIPYLLENDTNAVLGFSTDITLLKDQETELKQKDKILYQQAKISTMGEMIENIAHQWRQPLSVISTTATGMILKDELNLLSKGEFRKNMENINSHAQYLSNTIDDFRNYFLDNSKSKEINDLKEVIEKAIALIKDSYISSNINLIINLEDGIYAKCSKNLFIQALINIFNNSRDALGFLDGKINRYVFVNLEQDNKNIIIKIKDNANGIKEENLDKVFEPYFTTKHKSQGTGIGLYMTYQIISKDKNASISVSNEKYEYKNEKYKGACFSIVISKEDI